MEVAPDHPEGLTMVGAVLEDFERRLGPTHPSTHLATEVLAQVLDVNGRRVEAEECYRTALAASAAAKGGQSGDANRIRRNFFLFLASHDRLADAMALHEDAVAGLDETEKVIEQGRLADRLRAADRPQEAIAAYQTALRDAELVFGPDHVRTMNMRTVMAMFAMDIGHPVAEKVQRGVVADLDRVRGHDSEGALVARSNLAKLLSQLGREDEAAALYQEVVADQKRVLGSDHPGTIITSANLANVLFDLDRGREAVMLFRELLPFAERVLGRSSGHAGCTRCYRLSRPSLPGTSGTAVPDGSAPCSSSQAMRCAVTIRPLALEPASVLRLCRAEPEMR
jgi:tetratricopeptide (TPR) repeat protein